jgi:predicted enzyme related to lactoylglutathione lyase
MRTLWIAVILVSSAFAQQEQKTVDNKANNGRIDYIEFPATDVAKTKAFYERAFGWKFTDYGPDYTSFEDGRIAGGFSKEGKVVRGGPLVVLYASDLVFTEKKVRKAGGTITKDAFPFPGGRRFHFADPSGNELAVWSEK